jgi:CRISPR system Cascade subunit CasC
MNLIELHIIQSFPVTCLNRDDVGSPKSAIFGGTKRARLSSQSLKRAIRQLAREEFPAARFTGIRSRFLLGPFTDALIGAGLGADEAAKQAKDLCEVFSKPDAKSPNQVTTAVYLSPGEIAQIAAAIKAGRTPKQAANDATPSDAADIALFGRMVANDPNLNVEGAAMFSHALSTHTSATEVDFFSAVDDRKVDAEDAGAGMIGSLEFNSATYYRYAAVNLDLLRANLKGATDEEIVAVLDAFIRATLMAIPGARKNSMNGATLPTEALGIRKSSGQPLQLVNAFDPPVRANGKGLAEASVAAMDAHLEKLKRIWGLDDAPVRLTEVGLESFVTTLTA